MRNRALAMATAALLLGCGPDDNNAAENNATNNGNNGANNLQGDPGPYTFDSRYAKGESSVAYSGQVARQVLLSDLTTFIGSLNEQIDGGEYEVGGEGSVVESLDFYFRFDSDTYGDEPLLISTTPGTSQQTYNDISTGKDLVGKLAGNDAATDHKDFTSEFAGWSDPSIASEGGNIDSPEGFVIALFERLEANAIARADGVARTSPDGTDLEVTLTEEGQDLKQLTQKFIIGALTFSQGADDYLDDDTEGKGLLAPNERDEDANYTSLEHQWDEGFGYFGAAHDYLDYTDDEIADTGYKDSDQDGSIDLLSEYNFAASVNAAKRDRGSTTGTDLTAETFEAFWHGRNIIANAPEGELDEETLDALREQRDIAVVGWEKALAATVVHYINDTISASEALDTAEYSFADHAKVWSEMKGFALAFQFNPHSPLSDANYDEFHALVRDQPELDAAAVDEYIADLLEARDLLRDAYGFADEDVENW